MEGGTPYNTHQRDNMGMGGPPGQQHQGQQGRQQLGQRGGGPNAQQLQQHLEQGGGQGGVGQGFGGQQDHRQSQQGQHRGQVAGGQGGGGPNGQQLQQHLEQRGGQGGFGQGFGEQQARHGGQEARGQQYLEQGGDQGEFGQGFGGQQDHRQLQQGQDRGQGAGGRRDGGLRAQQLQQHLEQGGGQGGFGQGFGGHQARHGGQEARGQQYLEQGGGQGGFGQGFGGQQDHRQSQQGQHRGQVAGGQGDGGAAHDGSGYAGQFDGRGVDLAMDGQQQRHGLGQGHGGGGGMTNANGSRGFGGQLPMDQQRQQQLFQQGQHRPGAFGNNGGVQHGPGNGNMIWRTGGPQFFGEQGGQDMWSNQLSFDQLRAVQRDAFLRENPYQHLLPPQASGFGAPLGSIGPAPTPMGEAAQKKVGSKKRKVSGRESEPTITRKTYSDPYSTSIPRNGSKRVRGGVVKMEMGTVPQQPLRNRDAPTEVITIDDTPRSSPAPEENMDPTVVGKAQGPQTVPAAKLFKDEPGRLTRAALEIDQIPAQQRTMQPQGSARPPSAVAPYGPQGPQMAPQLAPQPQMFSASYPPPNYFPSRPVAPVMMYPQPPLMHHVAPPASNTAPQNIVHQPELAPLDQSHDAIYGNVVDHEEIVANEEGEDPAAETKDQKIARLTLEVAHLKLQNGLKGIELEEWKGKFKAVGSRESQSNSEVRESNRTVAKMEENIANQAHEMEVKGTFIQKELRIAVGSSMLLHSQSSSSTGTAPSGSVSPDTNAGLLQPVALQVVQIVPQTQEVGVQAEPVGREFVDAATQLDRAGSPGLEPLDSVEEPENEPVEEQVEDPMAQQEENMIILRDFFQKIRDEAQRRERMGVLEVVAVEEAVDFEEAVAPMDVDDDEEAAVHMSPERRRELRDVALRMRVIKREEPHAVDMDEEEPAAPEDEQEEPMAPIAEQEEEDADVIVDGEIAADNIEHDDFARAVQFSEANYGEARQIQRIHREFGEELDVDGLRKFFFDPTEEDSDLPQLKHLRYWSVNTFYGCFRKVAAKYPHWNTLKAAEKRKWKQIQMWVQDIQRQQERDNLIVVLRRGH